MPTEAPNSTPTTPRILALGLNSAWQKTLLFDALQIGEVNRVSWLGETGGGKGMNVARAAVYLGADVTVAQFIGGHTGELLRREQTAPGIAGITVQCDAPTRTCTTVVSKATGQSTELIEPSGTVAPACVAQLRNALRPVLSEYDGIALCGTYPPGVDESFYADTVAGAGSDTLVLLDGIKGVEKTLETGIDLLKINASELTQLAGDADIATAARVCFGRYAVRYIGVTDGPGTAYMFSPENAWRLQLPRLDSVQSAIGAGDCASAALLLDCVHRRQANGALSSSDVVEAFAHALACASASCLTAAPAAFDDAQAAQIRTDIHIEECPVPQTGRPE